MMMLMTVVDFHFERVFLKLNSDHSRLVLVKVFSKDMKIPFELSKKLSEQILIILDIENVFLVKNQM